MKELMLTPKYKNLQYNFFKNLSGFPSRAFTIREVEGDLFHSSLSPLPPDSQTFRH